MKKAPAFIAVVLCFFIILTGCKADSVSVTIGASEKFSEAEIASAVTAVQKKFKEFKGCTLIYLAYDEELSNTKTEGYLAYGRGAENGATADNTIVLYSDFQVDDKGGNGSFEPNSTTTGWRWILIRNSKTSNWKVDDWGY